MDTLVESLSAILCAHHVGLQVRMTHIEMAWLGYIAPSSATTATRSNFGNNKGEELHRASILCINWCSSCTQLFYLHACHSGLVCCLCIRLRNCPAFSNIRTLSPLWVHAVRVLILVSCCNEDVLHLIQVLGSEKYAERLGGGTK